MNTIEDGLSLQMFFSVVRKMPFSWFISCFWPLTRKDFTEKIFFFQRISELANTRFSFPKLIMGVNALFFEEPDDKLWLQWFNIDIRFWKWRLRI